MKELIFGLLLLYLSVGCWAQQNAFLSSSETKNAPLDGVVDYSQLQQGQALAYSTLRATDILWEKRIWRELDTREKVNHAFRYERAPFFSILMKGIQNGSVEAFSPENDRFSIPMSSDELFLNLSRADTVMVVDPVTGELSWQLIRDDFDPLTIMRYRIKEVWYFDSRYATLSVRILGIAPIVSDYDQNGNLRFERPLFWIYYPQARDYLAQQPAFNTGNNRPSMSWEDLLEMRFFSSYITKESNVFDRRLEEYLSGKKLLQESEKIKMEIFNYEHDLWSY